MRPTDYGLPIFALGQKWVIFSGSEALINSSGSQKVTGNIPVTWWQRWKGEGWDLKGPYGKRDIFKNGRFQDFIFYKLLQTMDMQFREIDIHLTASFELQ